MVSTGYKGPKLARGLHPSGLREVLVHNVNEAAAIDPKIQVARIAHTVGMKKRALIIAEAKKNKLMILNPGVEEASEEAGEKPEESEEPLVEAEEAQEKKKAKPKRGLLGRTLTRKAQKPAKKKSEKPKKAQKTTKTEEGAEGQ